MSLDAYGSFELKQAVVEGDIEHPTASVLCALPHELQITAISNLRTIAETPTAEQVLAGVEAVAFDLSKARFDRTPCADCLHNTAIAKVECSVAFKPDLCLFKDCADAGARNTELLQKRQLNKFAAIEDNTLSQLPSAKAEQFELVGVSDGELQSDSTVVLSAETASQPLVDPEVDEQDLWKDMEPALTHAEELDRADSVRAADESLDDAFDEVTDRDEQYIETARNAWWRASLKHAILASQDDVLMSDFLCSASFVPASESAKSSAVSYFRLLRDERKTMETLSVLVEQKIEALPLNVVKDFLAELQFDICSIGGSSIRLLAALSLEELEVVADEFEVPSTDALIQAYSQGPEQFAKALHDAIGEDALSCYAPPSLRVLN